MTRISIRSSLVLIAMMIAARAAAAPPRGRSEAVPEKEPAARPEARPDATPGPAAPASGPGATPGATPDQARSLTFDVPPEGGAYTIDVHPQILTVLHFPSEVRVAYCLDGPGHAEITHHQYSVTIRPDRRTRHAGVNVTTATNHVGVLLRVVDAPEDAVLQVHFRDQDVVAEIERRVSEAIAQRRAELEAALSARERRVDEKERRVDEIVFRAVVQQTADGLRRRFRVLDVKHTVRRDDAILRMHRAVRIGDDVHVLVSLENRRSTPVVIHDVEFGVDRVFWNAMISLPARGPDGDPGTVPPGAIVSGVITMAGAGTDAGKVVRLRIIEQDGREPFELGLAIED
jgi:hypothetical protein